MVERYLPASEGLNAAFYARAQSGTLHVQQCRSCGRHQHPPRHHCPNCLSSELDWAPVGGRGTLYSWTVTHHPFDRGWADTLPYTTAIVELVEGVRLVGRLADTPVKGLRIGLPVRVAPIPVGETFASLDISIEEGPHDDA